MTILRKGPNPPRQPRIRTRKQKLKHQSIKSPDYPTIPPMQQPPRDRWPVSDFTRATLSPEPSRSQFHPATHNPSQNQLNHLPLHHRCQIHTITQPSSSTATNHLFKHIFIHIS
ncbi:hypothetical protein EVAR_73007_1 [Eumeta japonica]|uniref:Uncharacterized protein n=1 Tax=Eumeta variegata TaxID=151549 RepID=A0A4C1TD82_EUMVA|nr:hypothetical protein EVAR_73007_1 [Eumeta japonica]